MTFLLFAVPVAILISLAVLWGNGGQLIVKVTSGRLTVTRVRPFWRKERSLPVTMEQPVFELRRYGGRSQGFGLLVATEHGQESVLLVDRARVDLLEVLQRELTAHFSRGAIASSISQARSFTSSE